MVDAQHVYLIINVGLFSIIDMAGQFLIRLFNILVRTNILYRYIRVNMVLITIRFNYYTSIDENI